MSCPRLLLPGRLSPNLQHWDPAWRSEKSLCPWWCTLLSDRVRHHSHQHNQQWGTDDRSLVWSIEDHKTTLLEKLQESSRLPRDGQQRWCRPWWWAWQETAAGRPPVLPPPPILERKINTRYVLLSVVVNAMNSAVRNQSLPFPFRKSPIMFSLQQYHYIEIYCRLIFEFYRAKPMFS